MLTQLNVVCDSNFSKHPLVEISANCDSSGSLNLTGCYNNSNYPTSKEVSEIIINKESVLYLDASDPSKVKTETLNNIKYVKTWLSGVNKNGKEFELSPSGTGIQRPIYEDDTGEIIFNGSSATHGLSNSDFKELAGLDNFTRIFVYTPKHSGSDRMLYYDGQTNYDAYYYRNFNFYGKLSTSSNSVYATIAANEVKNILNDNQLLQTTIFDNQKSTNAERFSISFFGNGIKYDSHYGSSQNKKTGSSAEIYIGHKGGSYPFKGAVQQVLLFDKAIDSDKLSRGHFYLRKKTKMGFRCSLPNNFTGFNIGPMFKEKTNDNLYFSDQVDVTCENGLTPVVSVAQIMPLLKYSVIDLT